MKLTLLQRKHLASLLDQRQRGVGFIHLMVRAKLLLLAHAVILAGAVFYWGQGGPWRLVSCGLSGLVLGSFVRFLRTALTAARVWPVTTQVIDWSKVEALLRADAAATTSRK